VDNADPHAALDDLTTYSLASHNPDGEAFLVHRFVQDVTRRGLAEARIEKQRLTEALSWIAPPSLAIPRTCGHGAPMPRRSPATPMQPGSPNRL
jgi:hypothetical protein